MEYSDFFSFFVILIYCLIHGSPFYEDYSMFTMVEALLILSLLTITGFLEALSFKEERYGLEKMINSWVANQVLYGDSFATADNDDIPYY